LTLDHPRLETGWTRSVQAGIRPDHASLRAHLETLHSLHAGFTESCAARCQDAAGRTSYRWLAEVVDPGRNRDLLDLACGSGPLLALCAEAYPEARLSGVDISPDELALARGRVPAAALHRAPAQDLDVLASASMDAVLCHWALTLMDPVAPVLREANRVLRPGGRFAAIVDGETASAPGYREVHDLIYGWVQRAYPHYGEIELGDPRVRGADSLAALARDAFAGARVTVEPNVLTLDGPPAQLAREAAGFFYAAFVLSPPDHAAMLADLAELFADPDAPPAGRFAMPINRLLVTRG
jgi:SAM-dependent methyltransferase